MNDSLPSSGHLLPQHETAEHEKDIKKLYKNNKKHETEKSLKFA